MRPSLGISYLMYQLKSLYGSKIVFSNAHLLFWYSGKGTQFFFTGWHIALPTYLSANKCLVFSFREGGKKSKGKILVLFFPRLSFFFRKKNCSELPPKICERKLVFFFPDLWSEKKNRLAYLFYQKSVKIIVPAQILKNSVPLFWVKY